MISEKTVHFDSAPASLSAMPALLQSTETRTTKILDLSSFLEPKYLTTINKAHPEYSVPFNIDDLKVSFTIYPKGDATNDLSEGWISLYAKICNVSKDDRRYVDFNLHHEQSNTSRSMRRRASEYCSGYGWSKAIRRKDLGESSKIQVEFCLHHDVAFGHPSIKTMPSLKDQYQKQYEICIKSGDIKIRVITPSGDNCSDSPPRKRRKLNRKCKSKKNPSALDGDEQENVVRVSSCILRAASPVFDQMMASEMKESQENEIEIQSKSLDDVSHLVYFMCTNELRRDADTLNVIALAHMYQMERLFWKCAEKISKTVTVQNFVQTVKTLNKYDIEQGFPMVVAFGKENIEKLKNRDDFPTLSCAFRRMILGVSSENE